MKIKRDEIWKYIFKYFFHEIAFLNFIMHAIDALFCTWEKCFVNWKIFDVEATYNY